MNDVKTISEILERIFKQEKENKELADNYAKEMLYGANSIDLNSQRYFEQILINFTRKKEIIIPKIVENKKNKYLYFDIQKDWKAIWDIIFLGEIINEEIIKNLSIKLDTNEVLEQDIIIENLPDGIKKQYIKKLKQSIRLIQKIKDSISHKENYNMCEEIIENGKKYVKIENLGGVIPFKGKILLNYLEGFVNNKIIPLKEDKEIANNADKVAYPLLEELGYDPKKIQNFFYRTNPNLLNYILKKLNGDYTSLYELPTKIYNLDINDLKKILEHPKVKNIKSLSGLPQGAFEEIENTFKLLEVVDKIEDLIGLPEDVFFEINLTFKLLEHPKVKNLNSLKKLPYEFFLYEDQVFKLLSHPKVEKVEDFVCFPNDVFFRQGLLFNLLDYSKVKSIHDLKGLSYFAFSNFKLTKRLLKKQKTKDKIYKMLDIEFIYPKESKKLLKHPKVDGIESLNNLPDILSKPRALVRLLKHPKVEGIESLINLNHWYFDEFDLLMKLLNNPKVKKIEDLYGVDSSVMRNYKQNESPLDKVENVQSLSGITIGAFVEWEFTLKLLEHPKVNSIESLKGLTNDVFTYQKEVFELLNNPKVKKIEDFRGLSEGIFEFLEVTLKLLDNPKIDNIEKLKGLPWEFFGHFYEIEKIYDKYDYFTIDIFKNMPIRLYEKTKSMGRETTVRIPLKSYENIRLNNLDKLLKRVDNNVERLFEFPDEFFTCDENVLEKMLRTYNINISKSIFGNYNPKTIYLISYMHSILTSYNFTKLSESESKKYAAIDLDCFKNATYINLNKKDNLQFKLKNEININQKKYDNIMKYIYNVINMKQIELFQQANDKIIEMINGLKQDLVSQKAKSICSVLGHLRNACSHFYFEELENLNTIRIYDINEEGKKTFDAVFDMENLFKLIKVVQNIDETNEINADIVIKQLNLKKIEELLETYNTIITNTELKKSLNLKFLENIKKYIQYLKDNAESIKTKHNKK